MLSLSFYMAVVLDITLLSEKTWARQYHFRSQKRELRTTEVVTNFLHDCSFGNVVYRLNNPGLPNRTTPQTIRLVVVNKFVLCGIPFKRTVEPVSDVSEYRVNR